MIVLVLCLPLSTRGANKKTTVTRVSTEVNLTDNVDYQITSPTPFAESGLVNIVNTEHAVLIMAKVKPSVAISDWLSHVQIDGAEAVDGSNCQVKLWDKGCIILPYGSNFKPLTVFSEQKYEGVFC